MNDLDKAKALLLAGSYTCVFCKGDRQQVFTQRGVRPLFSAVMSQKDFSGWSVADKVVGSGAAFLYRLLKVRTVYAPIMSAQAKEILAYGGILPVCDRLVPAIINRRGDGICPIESATAHCQTPEQALLAIEAALETLS